MENSHQMSHLSQDRETKKVSMQTCLVGWNDFVAKWLQFTCCAILLQEDPNSKIGRCGGSLVELWWLIGGVVVAYWQCTGAEVLGSYLALQDHCLIKQKTQGREGNLPLWHKMLMLQFNLSFRRALENVQCNLKISKHIFF